MLQVYETLSKTPNIQGQMPLSFLKDEITRKKDRFLENIHKGSHERDADLMELTVSFYFYQVKYGKKIYEEDEEGITELFKDVGTIETGQNVALDLGKLAEENDILKNKIQEQANEISNLNAKMKFMGSVGDNRRRPLSRTGSYTDRMGRSSRDLSNNRELDCGKVYKVNILLMFLLDEEDENAKELRRVLRYDDLYLMLRAQASSLELLLANEI